MIAGAARWLDRLGYSDSALHRLDARAKLVATAAFVLTVASFPKYEVAWLVPCLAWPAGLALAARLPAAPLFALLAAGSPFALLVGLWNPLLDRAPRELFGLAVAGGWLSFASILLRYALCASAALLLVATTSMPGLAGALGRLGLPRAFVTQLQLLYRYLFLLLEEGGRLIQARALREPGRRLPRLGTARRMLGSLLARSLARAERVHGCMRVRGFDGALPRGGAAPLGAAEVLFVGSSLAACLALRAAPWAVRALEEACRVKGG